MFTYSVITYDLSQYSDEEFEKILNSKATEGWELFFVAGGDVTKARFIFRKRS